MKVYEVVGLQKLDYLSRKTNQQVIGVNLFVNYTDDNIVGMGSKSLYISGKASIYQLALSLKPSDKINIFYDERGNVCDIKVIK